MRLATIRTGSSAVRIEGHTAIECPATDVGALLATPNWQAAATAARGAEHAVAGLDYAPVIPQPSKIICVGLNSVVAIRAIDRDRPDIPADHATSRVQGRAAELARWLTCRGGAEALQTFDGALLPELSAWL